MPNSTKAPPVVEGALDEEFAKRAIAEEVRTLTRARVRAGLETAAALAEEDPAAARLALLRLRADPDALERIEANLDVGSPERATMALGAAIQVAHAELSSPEPDLRARLPELQRWLDGAW